MSKYIWTIFLGFQTALLLIGCAIDPNTPMGAVIVSAVSIPLIAWLESAANS